MAQHAKTPAASAAPHNLQAPAKKPVALDYSKLTTDLPKLGKEIDAARIKVAKILDVEFQRLGLSAILAVQQHGNVHYVNALWLALPKGARHDAMTKWLLAFGGVQANPDKAKAKTMPFSYLDKAAVAMEKAAAAPWTTFAPSKPVEAFSVLAQIQKILKTVDGGKREVIGSTAGVEALREVAAMLEAEAEDVEGTVAEEAHEATATEA